MLPVDICAESIVKIAKMKRTEFIFHLANSKGISIKTLGDFTNSEGRGLLPITYFEWRNELVKQSEKDQELAVLLPYFPNSGYSGSKPYLCDCTNTKTVSKLDFIVGKDYVQHQVAFLEK
jgi:hypothetical protein